MSVSQGMDRKVCWWGMLVMYVSGVCWQGMLVEDIDRERVCV